jgi:fused signal recognition particle receptor
MGLFGKFISKITRSPNASSADWDDFEAALLQSDIGPQLSSNIIKAAHSVKSESALEAITATLSASLSTKSREVERAPSGPSAILVVGINGTGKTTSTAKLASLLAGNDEKVLLAAADTFRAAAVDQLRTWGERLDIDVVHGKENADPASVAFDAAQQGLALGVNFLIVDTAGRMHTKSDLMDQLGKVRRVIEKVMPVTEVLLVVDATTGQNGLVQAKVFAEAVNLTGIILTKTDGTARGGIALAIEADLGLPVKWIGTGESAKDFSPFDAKKYIDSLL